MGRLSLLLVLLCISFRGWTQSGVVVRDIKSFGAKGDGVTNDQAAFERAAAFFNARGGRGKLTLSRGTYLVGVQDRGVGPGELYLRGRDVLRFKNLRAFTLEGAPGSLICYRAGLRYGTFNPKTGASSGRSAPFFEWGWAATGGRCLYFDSCRGITVRGLAIDGRSDAMIVGGEYGDAGRQLPHYGIFLANCTDVTVERVTASRFALDGLCVANGGSAPCGIVIRSSLFDGNGRLGLSWIGGTGLQVTDSRFRRSGHGPIHSAPGAGVDVEAEWGPIRDGLFERCIFEDNKGCALVADAGNSERCTFRDCTFWGVENWSIWVTRAAFLFERCNIHGSVVHGYGAPDAATATRFRDCHFEDKRYRNGREVFGAFLVESNGAKRMAFERCTFDSRRKKLFWIAVNTGGLKPEEKYQFSDCRITSHNTNLPLGDFVAVMRGIRFKNCRLECVGKDAKKKGYYFNDCCDPANNVDAGGNTVTFPNG